MLSFAINAVKTGGFHAETNFKKDVSFLLDMVHVASVPLQERSYP